MLGLLLLAGLVAGGQSTGGTGLAGQVNAFIQTPGTENGERLTLAVGQDSSARDVETLWRLFDFFRESDPYTYFEIREATVQALCRWGDEDDFYQLTLAAKVDDTLLEAVEVCAVLRALRRLPPPDTDLTSQGDILDEGGVPERFAGASMGLRGAYLRFAALMYRWRERDPKGEDGPSLSSGDQKFRELRTRLLEGDPRLDWRTIGAYQTPKPKAGVQLPECGNGLEHLKLFRRVSMLIGLLREEEYTLALAVWLQLTPLSNAYAETPFGEKQWRDGFLRMAFLAGEPPAQVLLGALLHRRPGHLRHYVALGPPGRDEAIREWAHFVDEHGSWPDRTDLVFQLSYLMLDGVTANPQPYQQQDKVEPLPEEVLSHLLDKVSKWVFEAGPPQNQPDSERGFAVVAAKALVWLQRPESRAVLEFVARWPDRLGEQARDALKQMDAESMRQ